jgi:hypothetical protein
MNKSNLSVSFVESGLMLMPVFIVESMFVVDGLIDDEQEF